MLGLGETRDDEGRPLDERRAPALARQGVPTELRTCPYHDERKGEPMNVSALAQATRHLPDVTKDLTAFRARLHETGGWEPMLVTVLDALAAPAVYLLQDPRASIVPVRNAVRYKIAAGFYSALRRLLELGAQEAVPVTVDAFSSFVQRERLLIGPREACAGPPPMIRRLTELLMTPSRVDASADEPRVRIATLLAEQVELGVAWSLFDRAVERAFFEDWLAQDRLRPKNDFVRRRLAERAALVQRAGARREPPQAVRALPRSWSPARVEAIRRAVNGEAPSASAREATLATLRAALSADDGAVGLSSPTTHQELTVELGRYLAGYRAFAVAFWQLEQALRAEIGVLAPAPLELHGPVFGAARALEWYQAVVGHRLVQPPYDDSPALLRNQHRTLPLFLDD